MRLKKAFHLKHCIRAQEKRQQGVRARRFICRDQTEETKRLSSRTKEKGSFEKDELDLKHPSLFFFQLYEKRRRVLFSRGGELGFCVFQVRRVREWRAGLGAGRGELYIRLPATLPHKYDGALMTEQCFRHQVRRAAQTAVRCSSNKKLIWVASQISPVRTTPPGSHSRG